MAVSKRIVDGREQIWDDERMDWKDAQPVQQNLFLMPTLDPGPMDLEIDWFRPKEDPAERKSVFICGACESPVDKYTYFEGWECVGIDPECGDETEILDSGQDYIKKVEYHCHACGWSADQKWFDQINNANEPEDKIIALDIETHKQDIFGFGFSGFHLTQAQKEIQPKEKGTFRIEWPPNLSLLELDRIYRNFPGGDPRGSIWDTPRTSGNTD
jgi:predicted RNA-binding Zn-ribbon protein involved in translation (DUF1610 family)